MRQFFIFLRLGKAGSKQCHRIREERFPLPHTRKGTAGENRSQIKDHKTRKEGPLPECTGRAEKRADQAWFRYSLASQPY